MLLNGPQKCSSMLLLNAGPYHLDFVEPNDELKVEFNAEIQNAEPNVELNIESNVENQCRTQY